MTFNLPIGLFAFRWWMLLAVVVALLATEGYDALQVALKKMKISTIFLIIVIVPAVFFTSGYQKYQINSGVWLPSAGFEYSPDPNQDLAAYEWVFQNIDEGTPVFGLTFFTTNRLIGYDKFFCVWCEEDVKFRNVAANKSAEEIHAWMKMRGYEYLVVDPSIVKPLGPLSPEEATQLVQEMSDSGKFVGVHSTKTVLVLRPV